MQSNPRYVFFKALPALKGLNEDDGPSGAMGVPLTGFASVAADPIMHPLGSSLLVLTKRFGAQLVQVQDVGGGIKGAGRLDLFTGTGELAGNQASDLKEPLASLTLTWREAQKGSADEGAQLDVATALANCSGGM
jgi:membrane-bound lytic murein transglycosylase A